MSIFRNNYKILAQENKYELAEMSGKSFKELDSMFKYLETFEVSLFELEVIKKDLIGMAKEAEAEGVDFLDKVGMPEKEFCDSLIKDGIKPSYKERILPWIIDSLIADIIIYTAGWLLEGTPADCGFPLWLLEVNLLVIVIDIIMQRVRRKHAGHTLARKRSGMKDRYESAALFMASVFMIMFLPLPWEGFVIPGDGRAIFCILIALLACAFFGNNYYWNRCSEKYNWK